MNSHTVFAILGLVLLGSCALDIPPAPPPPATVAPEYDVESEGGAVVHHYNGSGTLLWIERHTLSTTPPGLRLKTYHYTAQNTLQWYEYRRFEQINDKWETTRVKHFKPPKDNGILESSESAAFSSDGQKVLSARFIGPNDPETLSSYEHNWIEANSPGRTLQKAKFDYNSSPLSFTRYRFDPAVVERQTGWAELNALRETTKAQTFLYADDKIVEQIDYTKSNPSPWERTTHSFLPSSTTEYRKTWHSAGGDSPPAADLESSPPTAKTVVTDAAAVEGSIEAAVNPDISTVSLVQFPTLTPPSWSADTLQGIEYYLPDASGGKTTLRFERSQLNALVRLPRSLVRQAEGALGAISVDFVWDAENRLIQRVVSYQQNPVLTVNLTRDGSGRITRIDTSGSMMKIPLTYTLTYDGAATRPQTLSLSTLTQDLLTLTFAYGNGTEAGDPFGVRALNFDAHVESIEVGVGGLENLAPAIFLDFADPVTDESTSTVTRSVAVSDIAVGDNDPIGTLVWTTDTDTDKTTLVWDPVLIGASNWTYNYSWGKWADMAAGITDTAEETVEELKARASQAMTLADSFDFEKIFQLVNAAQAQLPSVQEQLTRSAETLIDQVQTAAQD